MLVKPYKAFIFSLMLLSLALTVVMMLFMPDQIPAHYNGAGVIDRIGSKYESLIWPAVVSLFGLYSLLVDRFGKRLDRKGQLVIRILMGIVLLFFLGMSIFFMARSIQYGMQ